MNVVALRNDRPIREPHRASKPGAAAPVMARDTFVRPSLVEINIGAGHLLWRALGEMLENPGRTLDSFVSMLVEPFVNPVGAFERCRDSFKEDGWLQGTLSSLLYLSAAGVTASFVLLTGAFLAAPFTGGASLALAGWASTALLWIGFHDVAAASTLLLKDEWDAAHAETPEALAREQAQLADDFLNTLVSWGTLSMSNAATALAIASEDVLLSARSSLKPVMRGASRVVGRDVLLER